MSPPYPHKIWHLSLVMVCLPLYSVSHSTPVPPSLPRIRHLSLVVDTISASADILVMLVFLLVVLLVLFGTVFYFVEPDTFDSIPQVGG